MHGVLAQESGPIRAVFGSFENTFLWVTMGVSLIALLFAYYLVREVLGAPEGTEKMKEIAKAIQEGAKAYLSRQFRTLAVFLGILTVILFFILPAPKDAVHSEFSIKFGRSIAFILGAVFSATTGYVGMWLAVRANVRTANAARESGLRRAMRIAFRAGGVAGMFTVGLGLFGATLILLIYKQDATSVLVGFGFGGALLAMFMRVGGGIFTKAADVGADLVGKVEQGIPEDDPRNAATIADNVGDNVGDCAGMAADLFESYEVTLVASLILGAAAYSGSIIGAIAGVMFPLFVRAVGVDHVDHRHPRRGSAERGGARDEGDQPRVLHLGGHLRRRRVRDLELVHALLEAGLRRGVRTDPGEHHPGADAALHRHEAPAGAGDRGIHGHRRGDDGPGRASPSGSSRPSGRSS